MDVREISPKADARADYEFATLDNEDLRKVREIEETLRKAHGEELVVLVYRKKKGEDAVR